MDKNDNLLMEMLAALPDPVFLLSESGKYVMLVGGHDARYYHDGSHLVDFTLQDVLPKAKADWFLEQIRLTLEENALRTVEYALSSKDLKGSENVLGPDEELWFEGRIQPVSTLVDGERAVVWVARNITERYKMQKELMRLSELDELTGVYNRRKLMEQLAFRFVEYQRYQHPASLVILDLDRFKHINDKYGHVSGDKTLKTVTNVCAAQLREQDLLCRYGGEEFAILLPNTDQAMAAKLAERLRSCISEHDFSSILGEKKSVTLSAGVSAFKSMDDDIEQLIQRADDALYQAKANGRNRVVTNC
ncbi:diguanylate cyclase [Aliiglaciecola sp. CAU 1673]|uniref:sensor domain-containing diguanylate cyclase n=1 Tax=Aliiglaciecola sp. CAU 1673 TaxID=3032595 RepID=UPI0023DABFAA|nr:sensor domain-containing diguanylate cyclase [Aliiglaciecola sp. CAU 1673]MDF2178536.1 diguanylate cyclase [Aliiglaciecola sp. CAU 1673]